jgi:hypothetical protein
MEEPPKETVIIVHGTWAAPDPAKRRWYLPVDDRPGDEAFTAKLDAALQERGSPARCWAHCTDGNPFFQWSGENSWIARTQAAAELGNYVLKLRDEGWCCHIVAHSHGGNVVLDALPQITTALPSNAPLGKIVTLGTPFIDTMAPILQLITKVRRQSIQTAWGFLIMFLVFAIFSIWLRTLAWLEQESWPEQRAGAALGLAALGTVVAIVVAAAVVFAGKGHTAKPIARMQPKFLAIGSPMDEPWQLLNNMRNASNPMAVQTNLIRYLIPSLQSRISRSRQIARIYGAKSYRDLKPAAKLCLALAHLIVVLATFAVVWQMGIAVAWQMGILERRWILERGPLDAILPWFNIAGFLLVALFTFIFGADFFSALLSPYRWCGHRLGAIPGVFKEITTYIVRTRGWSVLLAIAMGLEGYRHQLPLIEQHPSSVPAVTYDDMPPGAQRRALDKRGDWVRRHLEDVSETFSKLVVTSADIKLLLCSIEADQTLVHAAYYMDDECIARIADWIAGRR